MKKTKGQEGKVEFEDGEPNTSSSVSYGKNPTRNCSVGGSSTTALIYQSDDEVFALDNDENFSCSKV